MKRKKQKNIKPIIFQEKEVRRVWDEKKKNGIFLLLILAPY
jgi:hypothetical protein